jgi:hypothetical protein
MGGEFRRILVCEQRKMVSRSEKKSGEMLKPAKI